MDWKTKVFKCKTCRKNRHVRLTYYRDPRMCGFCGHMVEYGREAKNLDDLVGITRMIIQVKIRED